VDIFDDWQNGAAAEIFWHSSTPGNEGKEVKVFSRRCGTPGAPALVCVHGFPTSSIDYFPLTRELGSDFDIFLLDFPGFGLSDKPKAPYVYSLYDDARLLVHAITRVWKLKQYAMLSHDRGTSVGMVALSMLAADAEAAAPAEVVLTNANIYLPDARSVAKHEERQQPLLDRASFHRAIVTAIGAIGSAVSSEMTGQRSSRSGIAGSVPTTVNARTRF
jgi:pimeloyl-ACP methyl ester carboxylesterase